MKKVVKDVLNMLAGEGRGLLKLEACLLGIALGRIVLDHTKSRVHLDAIHLVTDEIYHAVRLSTCAKFLHPTLGVQEGIFLGDIVNHKSTNGSSIVSACFIDKVLTH